MELVHVEVHQLHRAELFVEWHSSPSLNKYTRKDICRAPALCRYREGGRREREGKRRKEDIHMEDQHTKVFKSTCRDTCTHTLNPI